MPLGPGVRYRVKTTKSGKKIRLAFRGNTVVEAEALKRSTKGSPSYTMKEMECGYRKIK